MTLRITPPSWPLGGARARGPMVPRLGVVEVDDQPDAAVRDPDADADAVVLRVHQVDVVAAVGRLLALEEPVGRQDRDVGVARRGSRCSRPSGSCGSRRARSRSPGLPPMKWVQSLRRASSFAYGRETFVLMPLLELERRRRCGRPGCLQWPPDVDPATGPGAVHQAEVVALDGAPAAGPPTAPPSRRSPSAGLPPDAAGRASCSVGRLGLRLRDRRQGDASPWRAARPSALGAPVATVRRPSARTAASWSARRRGPCPSRRSYLAGDGLAGGRDLERGLGRGLVHRPREADRDRGVAGDRRVSSAGGSARRPGRSPSGRRSVAAATARPSSSRTPSTIRRYVVPARKGWPG